VSASSVSSSSTGAVTVTVLPNPAAFVLESEDSYDFHADVQGGTPTAYKWIIEPLAIFGGPGNNPFAAGWNVLSGGATQPTMRVLHTRWFATPDSNLDSETGEGCLYEVNCIVTVNGVDYRDQSPPWMRVGLSPTGRTTHPRFAGQSTILIQRRAGAGGLPVWVVAGQGSFRRTDPVSTVDCPPTSQFYAKVAAHEQQHVIQLTTDPRWTRFWDADALYQNTLSTLTSTVGEADLRVKIARAVTRQHDADAVAIIGTKQDMEREAYAADRAVAPHYLEWTDAEVIARYPRPPF
jgi:hypothetical protein